MCSKLKSILAKGMADTLIVRSSFCGTQGPCYTVLYNITLRASVNFVSAEQQKQTR